MIAADTRARPAGAAARQTFLDAMALVATSVSVVTTDGPGGRDGMAISAMTSVSADTAQPTLLICVNARSRPAPRLIENGVFCVNLLREDQAHLADRFGGRHGRPPGQWFDDEAWETLATGAPALAAALASFDCRVADVTDVGLHRVIFGTVQDIRIAPSGRPLIHARRRYHRLGP